MRIQTLSCLMLITVTGCFQNQETASLASNQNSFGEDTTNANSPEAQKAAGAVGARDSTQLIMTMATLTEVDPRLAAVTTVFDRVQDSLPQSAGLGALSGPQLLAHLKLASEFCRQIVSPTATTTETTARRTKFFPGITSFTAKATDITDNVRDGVITSLTQKFYRTTAATADEIEELKSLSDDLEVLQRTNATNVLQPEATNTVTHVLIGVCTAVLSSPKATLFY